MILNKISEEDISRALDIARDPKKLTWFRTILSETVPWLDTTNPIHEEMIPLVSIDNDGYDYYIKVIHGSALLHMNEADNGRGSYFFVDTPLDDFYFNCAGLSTSQRGPLHDIAHIYMNRGRAWGVDHKNNAMGYAMYLTYQISHELKKMHRGKLIY